MTIPVTIRKFSEEILVGIPHTKSATKWAEKRMPKQDKEVGHKRHNFAPQQAGNPLWGVLPPNGKRINKLCPVWRKVSYAKCILIARLF